MPALVEPILKLLKPLLNVIPFAFLGTLLYLILQKTMDRRLEKAKHELQLNLERMSVVFQHQKDSFRNVLAAMHRAIEAIEARVEPDGGPWYPIFRKQHDAFWKAVSGECLFLDGDTDRAIRLFSQVMWAAVEDLPLQQSPESDEVWRAYSEMNLIADRVTEHFRNRIGLTGATAAPLTDTELLGACRLINNQHWPTFNLPTKGLLKFGEHQTAEEAIRTAKDNLCVLESELQSLQQALRSKNSRASASFETLSLIERYLSTITLLKTGAHNVGRKARTASTSG
jgi:hypothetical protein